MSESTGQLRWQCRRGMRELDDLLLRYLENEYAQASADDKSAFRSVLQLPDPELVGYLLNRQQPASEPIARVVRILLGENPA